MPIRMGIAGLGRSGWNIHAATLRRLDSFQVVAVADTEEERRREAMEALGCVAHASPRDLIQDPQVEILVVATPSITHAPLAIEALGAGKHVIVEKPMAMSAAEVDEIVSTARRSGRHVTSFQNRRYDADFQRVREVIASGVLGPLHLAKLSRHGFQRRNDWQTLRKYGGGQLGNWGAHVLDQALLLLGGEYQQLFADLQTTVSAGDAEDHVKVVLKGVSGLVVDVEITSACAFPQPEWLIMGKYGTLLGRGSHFETQFYDPDALPSLRAEEGPAAGRAYGTGEKIPWKTDELDLAPVDSNAEWYRDFERAFRNGQPPPVSPQSVRQLISLMDEIRASSR